MCSALRTVRYIFSNQTKNPSLLNRVEEFRERVALVDFPSGNQITFGQARDLARFYLCTPSMVMVGEVEEEM